MMMALRCHLFDWVHMETGVVLIDTDNRVLWYLEKKYIKALLKKSSRQVPKLA